MDIKEIHSYEAKMLAEVDRICQEENITYYLAYGSVLGAVREKGIIPWDTDMDIMVKIDDLRFFLEVMNKKLPADYTVVHREKDSTYPSLVPMVVLKEGWHDLIHIDIFPMVGLPNNRILKPLIPALTALLYKSFTFKKAHYKKQFDEFVPKLKHSIRKIILYPIPIKWIESMYDHLSYKYPISEAKYIYSIASPYGTAETIPKDYLGNPVFMEFEGEMYPLPNMWDEYLTHIYGDYMTPKEENYLDYIGE